VLDQAKRNPESLLSLGRNVVIDDVQKTPQILPVIKRIVDKNRHQNFILSGSANLLLMKKEVNFVLEVGRKIIAIEVKLAKKINYDDIQNIQDFIEDHPMTIAGLVVYAGCELQYLTKNIIAVPWNAFC